MTKIATGDSTILDCGGNIDRGFAGHPSRYALAQSPQERAKALTEFQPANESLERHIAELLKRPLGRPSHKPVIWYKGFLYQAASWNAARRVVAKVEFHFGELFPRVGFIVTNLSPEPGSSSFLQ